MQLSSSHICRGSPGLRAGYRTFAALLGLGGGGPDADQRLCTRAQGFLVVAPGFLLSQWGVYRSELAERQRFLARCITSADSDGTIVAAAKAEAPACFAANSLDFLLNYAVPAASCFFLYAA